MGETRILNIDMAGGGIAIGGYSNSTDIMDTTAKVFVAYLDSNGNFQWAKRIENLDKTNVIVSINPGRTHVAAAFDVTDLTIMLFNISDGTVLMQVADTNSDAVYL